MRLDAIRTPPDRSMTLSALLPPRYSRPSELGAARRCPEIKRGSG
jgi:hypothetical protein